VSEVKRTERGYPGHFIGAPSCYFRRNTLLESGERRIVVSTVGNYRPLQDRKSSMDDRQIGLNRYYETMAFEAVKKGAYWEADVSSPVDFNSQWALNYLTEESDLAADNMHEDVVSELMDAMALEGRGA
jgi:hypothetical protein